MIWQHWLGHFAPRGMALLNGLYMFNFRHEDDIKNNKYFAAISMILYLSNKTIRRPPQSRETIPLIWDFSFPLGQCIITVLII
jgi:hypothetical protein